MALSEDQEAAFAPRSEARVSAAVDARLRSIRNEHFEFLWRSARRLGVSDADVDDVVQKVFIVAARKLDSITPGSERAFLFGTALRMAGHARRSVKRRAEVSDELVEPVDRSPSAEELMEQRRARALLDEVLEALPMDVRVVFILFELEEMTLAEVAALLDIPSGTAASRLRRGREHFQAEVTRLKARRRTTAA